MPKMIRYTKINDTRARANSAHISAQFIYFFRYTLEILYSSSSASTRATIRG